jgi:predicted RNase H-like nuclease (RuvC/YqgF family)
LSAERLEKLIVATKHNMARCATSITLQKIIAKYFAKLNRYLDQAISQANEMTMISESFAKDFGAGFDISDLRVRRLRLDKFKMEIARLEQEYSHLRDTKTLFFREQMSITNRFYESVCGASRKVFNRALRDANNWNKNLMVPLETHMRERHSRLSRRLESVKKIYNDSSGVSSRLERLETNHSILQAQQVEFYHMQAQLADLLTQSNTLTDDTGSAKPSTAEILYWEHQANF